MDTIFWMGRSGFVFFAPWSQKCNMKLSWQDTRRFIGKFSLCGRKQQHYTMSTIMQWLVYPIFHLKSTEIYDLRQSQKEQLSFESCSFELRVFHIHGSSLWYICTIIKYAVRNISMVNAIRENPSCVWHQCGCLIDCWIAHIKSSDSGIWPNLWSGLKIGKSFSGLFRSGLVILNILSKGLVNACLFSDSCLLHFLDTYMLIES